MICSNLFIILSSLFLNVNYAIKITSKSKNIILKEEAPATLWCAADTPFTVCQWEQPDGSSCRVGANEVDCISDRDIHFNGNAANCSIRIDRIQEDQTGNWACILPDGVRETVEVTVAVEPNVEIKDAFGTVVIVQGHPRSFKCVAEGGRPAGKFIWRIGDAKDPKGTLILTNPSLPVISVDENKYASVAETLSYVPDISHHERKLYCIYSQADENGKEILSKEDHITLSIFYLEEPAEGKRELPEAEAGTNLTVSIEFGAKPKPDSRDVIWQISSKAGVIEIVTEDAQIATKDHYLAFPIELIGENRYRVTLVIQDVQESEQKFDHSLKISTRFKKDSEPIHSVTHKFLVSVAPHNDHGAGDGTDKASVDESGASSVTLIVVIVLLLVLAVVIAVGTVFYAKKNQKWCFAVADPRNDTIRQPDPEIQAPLNQEDPKARPIIKHKYSRPE